MALESLEPAFGPATTKSVLFDTLPATFAPDLINQSLASPRDNDSKVPVKTKVLPEKI